jgi:hypothetical protein
MVPNSPFRDPKLQSGSREAIALFSHVCWPIINKKKSKILIFQKFYIFEFSANITDRSQLCLRLYTIFGVILRSI